jgi:hypothetical protein
MHTAAATTTTKMFLKVLGISKTYSFLPRYFGAGREQGIGSKRLDFVQQ